MTGGVFLVAFLATYLTHRCPAQVVGAIKDNYATLLVPLLSTPLVGWAISAIVLVGYYRRHGHPYHGPSRTRIKEWVMSRLPDNLSQIVESGVQGDDLFSFAIHGFQPEGFIEWGRRRHTSRFMGWNWAVATSTGLSLGLIIGPHNDWQFGILQGALLVFVVVAVYAVVKNGVMAAQEIEKTELLWVEDFIHRGSSVSNRSGKRDGAAKDSALYHQDVLEAWASGLKAIMNRNREKATPEESGSGSSTKKLADPHAGTP